MKLWRYGRPIESLGQRYRLDGMLGSGGMADVCLAWDEREGREAAVKILKSDDLDQETLNRFMKEAAQIAGWQHPNTLRIYESMQVELVDASRGSVLFYMVTEYARGGDLHKRLSPGRPFPLASTFALFRQLCGAVQYAHDQGIIHRDLKPLNILFRRPAQGPEEVVLSDFGLAVQVAASHHTFARGGTLAYMAPEQFQGHALPASDIFALGIIIYQLCTGYLPFRRTIQDISRMVDGSVPLPMRPSLLNPELPGSLDEIILRALRELPTERYRGAQEFWDAIALALVSAAPTFSVEETDVYTAGQTWPIGNSEQSPAPLAKRAPERGRAAHQIAAASGSLPAELRPPAGEGPGSDLESVREKQKASPDRIPGLSLPINSILTPPNAGVQLAAEDAQAHLLRPESRHQGETASDGPNSLTGAVWGGEFTTASYAPRSWSDIPFPHAEQDANDEPPAHMPPSRTRHTRQAWDEEEEAFERGGLISDIPERASAKRTPSVSPPYASRPSMRGIPDTRASVRTPNGINATKRNKLATRPEESYQSFGPGAPSLTRGAQGTRDAADPHTRAARGNSTRPTLQPLVIQKRRPPRTRKFPLRLMLTTLGILLLLTAIVLAASSQGWLLRLFGAPITTVTLTPRSQLVQQDVTLSAVATNPDPNRTQIQLRTLTTTSPTRSTTANASGSIPAKKATGILTFINNGSTPITVHPTIITDNNGVQVSFNDTVIVPATPPSSLNVLGFAVNPGVAGNIPVLDIVKSCCATNIIVKNTSAFTDGQDAQAKSVIEQKDIDDAANGLLASLKSGTLATLQGMLRGSERMVAGSQHCQPQINADQRAGSVAKTATVQVALKCSEQVYNYGEAQQIALRVLQDQIGEEPYIGSTYKLEGQVALTLVQSDQAGVDGLPLTFAASGLWVYPLSQSALRQFTSLIAGKSETDARQLLLKQPGVAAVQFQPSGTLPVNPGEIQMQIAPLHPPEATPDATSTPINSLGGG